MTSIILIYLIFVKCFLVFSEPQKPNIVLIVADDLGWNDLGFHGSNQIPTPNIDALAYSGVILQNYYVLPICTPSRSALMTGRHPIHTGMQHRVIFGNEPWGLPLEFKILPQYLKELGYRTHAVGKWHLGHFKANYTPTMRGFESHFGYWTGRQDYYDHTAHESVTYWGYDMRRGLDVAWDAYGKYSTNLFTEESLKIIEQHDTSTPLFLYTAHLAVHSANPYQPLQAPLETLEKFHHIKDPNRKIYAGMVTKLDESVGRIVDALSKKEMLQNTLIIFTTDNGGPAAGFNSNAASNWPLRGVKDTLWEGGVRGCAFVWSQNVIRSRVVNNLMHIQDWLPTILAAIKEDSEIKPGGIDGKNMWPAIRGDPVTEHNEVLLNIDQLRNISALRKGDWKIISGYTWDGKWDGWYGPSGREENLTYNMKSVKESVVANALSRSKIGFPSEKAMLTLRSKTTVTCKAEPKRKESSSCDLKKNAVCLFNITADPCEQNNLANQKKNIVSELMASLKEYKPVQPLNKPGESASNPVFWNYTWTNWKDYV